jgi:hypothetical protein
MAYLIHYRNRNDEIMSAEWVAPHGWGQQAIRTAFLDQYATTAEILSIEPQP